jgi:DNA invertase Pin-like site-specific DNA recombinase
MARIGYARVSTVDQDLDGQVTKLRSEGCELVRSEKLSGGSRTGRAELATVLAFLRPGDELVVTRLDRLGRDTRDVLNLIHECQEKGASLTVLDPYVSTKGDMGHVVLTVLGMVAQMERRFIRERQREGIERAKASGIYRGGKRRLDRERIKAMLQTGRTPSAIASELGCSRMQIYRIKIEDSSN